MTATAERMIGPHRIVQEAEDLLVCYFAGPPTETEMRSIVDLETELAAGKPIFLIIDLRKVESLSAGTRREIGEAAKKISFLGFAIVGGSFQMRVIAKLLNSALGLFSKSQIPQEFFDDPEAARAWVARSRGKSAVGA